MLVLLDKLGWGSRTREVALLFSFFPPIFSSLLLFTGGEKKIMYDRISCHGLLGELERADGGGRMMMVVQYTGIV